MVGKGLYRARVNLDKGFRGETEAPFPLLFSRRHMYPSSHWEYTRHL